MAITVDLNVMSIGSSKMDRLGHLFEENMPDPVYEVTYDGPGQTPNGRTYDGWLVEASAGASLGGYLPGNYGVIYHYTIYVNGAGTKQGAILIGRNGPATDTPSGLVILVGSEATVLGPVENPETKAWVVAKTAGGAYVEFDVIIPSNVDVPYDFFVERYR